MSKEEYKDFERCAKCGGKCCRLYAKESEGGMCPDEINFFNDDEEDSLNFDNWYKHTVWYKERNKINVEPLFDVLKVNEAYLYKFYDKNNPKKKEADRYLKELKEKGIDITYCAYWTKESGCIIPWENRPSACKKFRCNEWIEDCKDIVNN